MLLTTTNTPEVFTRAPFNFPFKPLRQMSSKIIYTLFTLLSDLRLELFHVANMYAVGSIVREILYANHEFQI